MELYPLKFRPIFKYRMWGGEKLKTLLNKDYKEESVGESWEISNVEGDETLVSNGIHEGKTLKELSSIYRDALVGENVYKVFGDNFPLLIKYIDAKTPLSIQVHPSNEIAKRRHNSFGKNEMWYIMQANEDAELIVGFSEELNAAAYKEHLDQDSILDVLHHEKVQKGDTFYIPTGRVHAIGAGVLLAEIQQTSDITYRIYDYNRVDRKTGKMRELHNDLALDVLDYSVQSSYKTTYDLFENISNTLVHSHYFKTNIINLKGTLSKQVSEIDSFIIYMCVDGEAILSCYGEDYKIAYGETILLPASLRRIDLKSRGAKLIEVFYE